jgi:uncharacterized protein (TIGR00255 family)
MIKSMTAFARQSTQTEKGQLTWELRSVNHRYSEVSLRLPDDFRALETEIREKISKTVKRGKLDLNLRLQRNEDSPVSSLELDTGLVEQLTTAAAELGKYMDGPRPMGISEVLHWPGVLISAKTDTTKLQQQAIDLLDLALEELLATREREGEQMQKVILERCASIRTQVLTVKEFLPDIIKIIRDRAQKKLDEYDVTVDEGRMEQEIVLMANRADVAEEVDRLDAHIIEIERVLQQDQPVGRRLDFLMQELNREANTLGSKAIATPISQASIELKVLIEQMREQIQNIE